MPSRKAAGGSDVRSASTRSPGLVSKDAPRCSSTPLWNRTTSPCDFGRRSDFTSSGPFPRLLSTPRWAASAFTSCTDASDARRRPLGVQSYCYPHFRLACLSGEWVMLLLGSPHYSLHFATARHIIDLVSSVFVFAFTAKELIPLPV